MCYLFVYLVLAVLQGQKSGLGLEAIFAEGSLTSQLLGTLQVMIVAYDAACAHEQCLTNTH